MQYFLLIKWVENNLLKKTSKIIYNIKFYPHTDCMGIFFVYFFNFLSIITLSIKTKEDIMEEKSTTGIEEPLGGLLSYLFGWITGLIFFILEKKNKYIRFHALQSLLFFGGLNVLAFILSFIPFLGFIINLFIIIIGFIFWVTGMIKAYNKNVYLFPIVGEIAKEQIYKDKK